MTVTIPATPKALGLDHPTWRQEQISAIRKALHAEKLGSRHVGLCLPTGVGKTAVAITIAKLLTKNTNRRAAILTSTRALQDQYNVTDPTLADIRGMRNYPCLDSPGSTCERGPCRLGEKCHLKLGGCVYFDRWRSAADSKIAVTSYAYWLAGEDRLGDREILILDEAHDAKNELLNAVGAEWLESSLPCRPAEAPAWARMRLREMGEPRSHRDLNERRKLEAVARVKPDWSMVVGDNGLVVAEPRNVKAQAERLFKGASLVVWMSATLSPRIVESMVDDEDADAMQWHEAKSPFPVQDRPIIWVPTGRMSARFEADSLLEWKLRIDQIVGRRLDRRGVVHTVSYKRRDLVKNFSRHRHAMLTHESANDIDRVVKAFETAGPPAILVSPSVGTGFDLGIGDYQIIGKVPFPSKTDPRVRVRSLSDPDYVMESTVQALVQMCGRINRKKGQRRETFIIDDDVSWLVKKHRELFPKWWLEAYRSEAVLKPPIPL